MISCNLQIGPLIDNKHIRIFGCYAVPQGNHEYGDRSTRESHRRKLYSTLSRALHHPCEKNSHSIGEIVLGDIQETITQTKRDNQGGCNYSRLKFGVLNAITNAKKTMASLVFEYEGEENYITRKSLSESTGAISHILASPKVEDLYIGGYIDKLISSFSIISDHHIVAADFILDIPSAPAPHGQPVTKFKWGKISNILVDPVYEREDERIPTTIVPRWNTPHTDNWKENWQLFHDIQELAGEGSENGISVADKFNLDMAGTTSR